AQYVIFLTQSIGYHGAKLVRNCRNKKQLVVNCPYLDGFMFKDIFTYAQLHHTEKAKKFQSRKDSRKKGLER
ncbi:hypothetical protein AC249_AIPGENE11514, partial [Exaiptasia diaphana]